MKLVAWTIAYFFTWVCNCCPVPVEKCANDYFALFCIRFRFIVPAECLSLCKSAFENVYWEIRSQNLWKIRWKQSMKKCLLRTSENLLEPGVLFFTALMKQAMTISIKHPGILWLSALWNSRTYERVVSLFEETLRCENRVEAWIMDPGSPLRSHFAQNHSVELRKSQTALVRTGGGLCKFCGKTYVQGTGFTSAFGLLNWDLLFLI